MLNTKPEVPFTDFYAGKYFANGWIKFDIFLSFTRTACHMGEKSICRMVSYTLTTIQINGGITPKKKYNIIIWYLQSISLDSGANIHCILEQQYTLLKGSESFFLWRIKWKHHEIWEAGMVFWILAWRLWLVCILLWDFLDIWNTEKTSKVQ